MRKVATNKNIVPPELVPFCEALAEILADDYLRNINSEKRKQPEFITENNHD